MHLLRLGFGLLLLAGFPLSPFLPLFFIEVWKEGMQIKYQGV